MLPNNFPILIQLILSPYPLKRMELSVKINAACGRHYYFELQEFPVAKGIKS